MNCPKCDIPLVKGKALIQGKIYANSFRHGIVAINDYTKIMLVHCSKCPSCGYSTT